MSEATRRVVLRPLPHRLGPLRVASLNMAAEDEAQIGGDLYAATRVEDSTRMIIGDVRGKGLTSISDASVLMGAFREAAHGSSASRTPDTFAFKDGDTLLLSTDGVIETRAPTGPSIRWPNGPGSGGAPVPKGFRTTSAAICWTMSVGGWATTPPWWSSSARRPSTRCSS
ncbi:hypothetical protein [Streptomyces sp. 11-1-2]|uniref:hypothetical protein n=1 Tax=Streptomyces sp. Mo3 TaxID=3161190 RepID=UPI0019697663